jgi:hypothetical protein
MLGLHLPPDSAVLVSILRISQVYFFGSLHGYTTLWI